MQVLVPGREDLLQQVWGWVLRKGIRAQAQEPLLVVGS